LGTHDGRKGWINRLAVAPEFRHQGIAQLLLKEAEEEISRKGIEIVTCLIEDYNQTSMDFFQKAGYIKHNDIIYFTKRKYPQV
jgi:ribosomal protein S18 acetylase RimI-like enzyme